MPGVVLVTDGGESVLRGAVGESVMRVVQKSGAPSFGECDGSLACATCHVVVEPGWAERLTPATEDEEAMLDTAFDLRPTSRLSCQIMLSDALDEE